MREKTLILIKPDAVQRGLIGDIITRFERCGLKIVAMKMHYADKNKANEHYTEDEEWMDSVGTKTIESNKKKGIETGETPREIGQKVRAWLMNFLTMSPVIALVIEGHNAVRQVRKIVGATSPEDAMPGTIRGDYSFETYKLADDQKRAVQNLIHASDTTENAQREINIWFSQKEIYAWKRIDEELLYRTDKKE